METLWSNIKVGLALVFIVILGWLTLGTPVQDIKHQIYLQRWADHWGQRDACIGFYAAYALKNNLRASYEALGEKCQEEVSEKNQFYLGYPQWRWQSSQELGKTDPFGSF